MSVRSMYSKYGDVLHHLMEVEVEVADECRHSGMKIYKKCHQNVIREVAVK